MSINRHPALDVRTRCSGSLRRTVVAISSLFLLVATVEAGPDDKAPPASTLGATKCPAFWPFGSTRPSLGDHNFAKVGELELDKRQARSNTGFPGNHHARLEFGLITCLDSSWPLSFVLAPISMTAWIWDQADHRPVLRSQACAGLRDWRDLCLYFPVQHHQDCAVCSWRRQRNPHQPSMLLIIHYIINI
jgi:hypothetical protein